MLSNPLAAIAPHVPLFVAFLFSLCFHEFAHGWVAKLKGDRTAEQMGRLTLNPFAHADPVGTFALPILGMVMGGVMFGWAKPVPVNTRNLKQPRKDMFWIASAGPLSNIVLASISGFLWVLFQTLAATTTMVKSSWGGTADHFLQAFLLINLYLAVFNMLPLHPLDGGKVLARFLPTSANQWLEDNQAILNILLIVMFVTGGFVILSIPVKLLANIILMSSQTVINAFI